MKKLQFAKLVTIGTIAGLAASTASATIAYDNDANLSGLQDWGGSLGLTFTVNQPIEVTSLGAFDNGSVGNLVGVSQNYTGVSVGIFTSGGMLVTPLLTFTPTTPGMTQIGGDAFQSISPIDLSPGNYVVVAYNDENYNSQGVSPNTTSQMNTGGGALSFTSPPFYGTGYTFPETSDVYYPPIGPANRYDAGTFAFQAVPEPSTIISGALLVLPFGASTLRAMRKRLVAQM